MYHNWYTLLMKSNQNAAAAQSQYLANLLKLINQPENITRQGAGTPKIGRS